MTSSNTAFDNLQRVDKAIEGLMNEVTDQSLKIGQNPSAYPYASGFNVDAYWSFVRQWSEYKFGNERRKAWFFSPTETIDECNTYFAKNLQWRTEAEAKLGLPKPQVDPIKPDEPLPKDDPRRTGYPYEDTIKFVAAAVIAYMVLGALRK